MIIKYHEFEEVIVAFPIDAIIPEQVILEHRDHANDDYIL